jgi:hypothetical protein
MRTSVAARADQKLLPGAPDGGQAGRGRRACGAFFLPLPQRAAELAGRRRRSSSSARGGAARPMIGLRSGRGRVLPSAADAPARRSSVPRWRRRARAARCRRAGRRDRTSARRSCVARRRARPPRPACAGCPGHRSAASARRRRARAAPRSAPGGAPWCRGARRWTATSRRRGSPRRPATSDRGCDKPRLRRNLLAATRAGLIRWGHDGCRADA